MNFIIAGGGTGGHIYPAIAIANALKSMHEDANILFVGANGKMEMEKVPKEGYPIIGLDIVGFNRSNIFKNILLPFKLLKSSAKAAGIIKSFKPDAVIGVGGFASFPMLNAAQNAGIPTIIQEQNSYAGKSNKILGKKAKAICVAYDNMHDFFPAEKIIKTGNPVRKLITAMHESRSEGVQFFGLSAKQKTILVVGGSLGAQSINESIANDLNKIVVAGYQLIWQTGKHYIDQAKIAAAPYGDTVKVFEFIYEMDKAYSAADVVISRAGALAIAELCIVGKPVVFVPYPHAAEDHQTSNAMALVNNNAGVLVKDSDARKELVKVTLDLIQDEQRSLQMKAAIAKLAVKDADQQIAAIITNLIK